MAAFRMAPRVLTLCVGLCLLLIPPFLASAGRARCPCSEATLCDPIKTTPKTEILAYSNGANNWVDYVWENITTFAVQNGFDPQMMCHAHSKGVRIVVYGSFSEAVLLNDTARKAWVQKTVQEAIGNFTDGYNIDFETPLPKTLASNLTDAVREITEAFKTSLPYSKVTFASSWNPNCTLFGRCYDYESIGEIVDYIMIMAYDELIFDDVAMANAPLDRTEAGLDEFLRMGVPASKLVLGVPWYGYDFPCEDITDTKCTYKMFRQGQRGYGSIMKLLADNSTSGRMWSGSYKSPYFNYKDINSGQTHQVWYDDPTSLDLRYNLARSKNLYGWAAFNADCLDYSNNKTAVKETKEMWETFVKF